MIKGNLKIILLTIFSAIGFFFIAHVFNRTDFWLELLAFALCFTSYFIFILRNKQKVLTLFLIGLVFRLIFIWGAPKLSDDYYRFIWDGTLITQSINPYEKLPSEFKSKNGLEKNKHNELMFRMNSPYYYSVYPPLQQLFFMPAGYKDNIPSSLLVLRMIVLIGEILLFIFLIKFVQSQLISVLSVSWIWLNPLWIIEVNGNLHFEGWMLTFVAAAIYFLQRNKNYVSALFFSLAAGLKLIPLMILPIIKKWKGINSMVLISAVTFILFMIPFLLFVYPYQNNFYTSIDLYYHKFEFNASFYFVLKWLGFQFSDLHPIVYLSQVLISVFLGIYIYLFFKSDKKNLNDFFFTSAIAFTTYYLLATTVHPWYILTVLFFSVLSGKYYGIIWSGLVFLSYSAYSGNESFYYLMITLEYLLLFIFMFLEFKNKLRLS